MRNQLLQSSRTVWLLWACAALLPLSVRADAPMTAVVYDRVRGELSPGTEAPSLEQMMNSVRSASPTGLTATLEYGQHVECLECVPLLESKLLASDNAKVREMSAWWLRQRAFGYGRVAVAMRQAVSQETDPARRSRAAEALGEFLDVGGLPALERAAMEDKSASVRVAAVSALGRLNAVEGHAVIAAALDDTEPAVRSAALDQVLRVNNFSDTDALLARLGDGTAEVRASAARLVGQKRVAGAGDALSNMLKADKDPAARQAAAWALGRVGGGQETLRDARVRENEPSVLDAIDIALKMTP
jgi:hypothetical protein